MIKVNNKLSRGKAMNAAGNLKAGIIANRISETNLA
jgi:hypothetical protein